MAKGTYTSKSSKADTTRNKSSEKMGDNKVNENDMVDLPEGYDEEFFAELAKQVDLEYLLAWDNQSSKIEENLSRLRLYNNQKRDKNAVGDPLLFTVHQTVLASLYDDKLAVEWDGYEEGDEETANNLNDLAEFDNVVMQKDILDYFWMWDTGFFGRGLLKMFDFNRDKRKMCPVPELIDPMTWLRDPKATSVNGDVEGRGAMRFGGREIRIPRGKITQKNGYFNFSNLKTGEEIKSLYKRADEARNEAQGRATLKNKSDEDLGDNARIPAIEWYTHFRGKKCIVVLTNDRKKPIKYVEIGDEKSRWPIIDRPLYPHSHDWDGTSIPDLVEDKQRQRAVMINLGIQSVKSDMYPMYLFDESRVKNKSDLTEFVFNKFVGVSGDGDVRGAVQPMNKANPRMDLVNFILETLDVSAQKATATPDIKQGIQSQKDRPLGETNLLATGSDTRYSLAAKVFGWSERDFWRQWYSLYKEHYKDGIDKKVIRISGSFGTKWRELTRENIISREDPDVKVESKVVAENKRIKERVMMNAYGQVVLADANSNKAYFMRKLAKLNGLEPDEIKRLYPPTIDEMIADQENDKLSADNLVQVSVNDDDLVHIEMHSKAAETKAKAAHIQAHMDSMVVKRQQPDLFGTGQLNQAEAVLPQNAGTPSSSFGSPNIGQVNTQPSQAASPTPTQ